PCVMKKILFAALLLSASVVFSSCEKLQDASVTFYVTNAGSAGKWDYISVEIAGKSGTFFTPERRNMGLGNCEGDAHAATFNLPPGTYSYTAKGSASWSGSVTVDNGDC